MTVAQRPNSTEIPSAGGCAATKASQRAERCSTDRALRSPSAWSVLAADVLGVPCPGGHQGLQHRDSIIVTSNRGFDAWGEILGDAMVAAALIDRLVHPAHIITLKGESYRLRERGTGPAPAVQPPGFRPSA